MQTTVIAPSGDVSVDGFIRAMTVALALPGFPVGPSPAPQEFF
jgi:hypothetical protein